METEAALNPVQQRALDDLLDRSMAVPRPEFPEGLHRRLKADLEERLRPTFELLETGGRSVFASKQSITRVLQCEHHFALGRDSFEWTVASARGTIAHRAIDLGLFDRHGHSPVELTDAAVDLLVAEGNDRSPGPWLEALPPIEQAELRSQVSELVTAFEDMFPPVSPRWRPRVEARSRVELFGGTVVLQSRPDLGLGRAEGRQARVLLLDIKTGRPHPAHVDDLRFYALVETLKLGVPPFRVASLYVESATWHAEDVTEELLDVAVRRVVGAVERLAALELGVREATRTAGPQCGWCVERDVCPAAVEWRERQDDPVDGTDGDDPF